MKYSPVLSTTRETTSSQDPKTIPVAFGNVKELFYRLVSNHVDKTLQLAFLLSSSCESYMRLPSQLMWLYEDQYLVHSIE